MKYFKQIDDGYILAIGTGNGETEITETEYNAIFLAIQNKPPRTDTTEYRLCENLTWEEYTVDPPDPDPEIEDAEVYDILFGGGAL